MAALESRSGKIATWSSRPEKEAKLDLKFPLNWPWQGPDFKYCPQNPPPVPPGGTNRTSGKAVTAHRGRVGILKWQTGDAYRTLNHVLPPPDQGCKKPNNNVQINQISLRDLNRSRLSAYLKYRKIGYKSVPEKQKKNSIQRLVRDSPLEHERDTRTIRCREVPRWDRLDSKGNLWSFGVDSRSAPICTNCHHALCAPTPTPLTPQIFLDFPVLRSNSVPFRSTRNSRKEGI